VFCSYSDVQCPPRQRGRQPGYGAPGTARAKHSGQMVCEWEARGSSRQAKVIRSAWYQASPMHTASHHAQMRVGFGRRGPRLPGRAQAGVNPRRRARPEVAPCPRRYAPGKVSPMGRSAYQQRQVSERRRGLTRDTHSPSRDLRSSVVPGVLLDPHLRLRSGALGSLLFGSSPIGARAVRVGRMPGWRVECRARSAACLVAAEIDDVVAVGACKFVKLLRPSKRCSAKVTVEIRHL